METTRKDYDVKTMTTYGSLRSCRFALAFAPGKFVNLRREKPIVQHSSKKSSVTPGNMLVSHQTAKWLVSFDHSRATGHV